MENNSAPTAKLVFSIFIASIVLTACNASEPEVVVQYQYDALGRLNQVEDTVNGNRVYQYDPVGNRTSLSVMSASSSTSSSGSSPAIPLPPAPTNARKVYIADCAFEAKWDASPNTNYYQWSDTNASIKTIQANGAQSSFSVSMPCLNMSPQPSWVRSCNDFGCSPKVDFQ